MSMWLIYFIYLIGAVKTLAASATAITGGFILISILEYIINGGTKEFILNNWFKIGFAFSIFILVILPSNAFLWAMVGVEALNIGLESELGSKVYDVIIQNLDATLENNATK